ncbi:MAG TPA: SprT family zinc-dependent metalloprotease [Oleiagrimonas sp.]|nr:SprT family zinc-dependent metalloprotease [Oleiagrimonas sp.]
MDLAYTTRRSAARKKVTITVERDRTVVVHAPMDTSEEKLARVVESRRLWIYEKLHHAQKYQPLPHPPGKELVSGESALYLGRSYRIELVDGDDFTIRFANRFYIPRARASQRKQVLRQWYIDRAQDKILPRVLLHAKHLGVTFGQARIVDNRYRWGSCTPKDNLSFNWRLIKAPMFVIDYVLIHELAHLLEANHTPRFWSIVHAQTASMERARQWLRENGQSLEEEV